MTMTTTSELLFDADDPAGALQEAVDDKTLSLGPFRVAGVGVPENEVWSAVGSVLDEPIVNLAMQGWSGLSKVRTVKARTLEFPGTTEVVRLLKHTLESTQEPTVELSVGPVSADVLTFTVTMSIRIDAVELTIAGGEINKIDAGTATASATLAVGDTKLMERTSRPVDLNFLRLVS